MLCNPVSSVGYAVVVWKFFNGRIEEEELLLLSFFEDQYSQYREKVGVGIPFMRGSKQKAS